MSSHTPTRYYPGANINLEFHKYVHSFEQASKIYHQHDIVQARLSSLQMNFGNSRVEDVNTIAFCRFNQNLVIVEKETWDKLKEFEKQALVDHELGHCLLGRIHRHILREGNTGVSLMYPDTPGYMTQYETLSEDFRKELFNSEFFNKFELADIVQYNYFTQHPEQRTNLSPNMKKEIYRYLDNVTNGDE